MPKESKTVLCKVGMWKEDGAEVEGEQARNCYANSTKRLKCKENNAKSRDWKANGDRIGPTTLIVYVNFISEVVLIRPTLGETAVSQPPH